MSFTPGDPRAPAAALGATRDLPGDPLARPARGTGTILVTGATGRLGRVVCRLLNEAGVAHRALVRAGSDRSGLGRRTWMIDGDLTVARSLSAPLDGVEEVLHLAGLVRSSDRRALDALHVQGTRALVSAAQEAGVRRIVAVSSDTVLRIQRGPYAESKAAMEDVLRDAEVPSVVLRPPMILGPDSPHLRSMEAMARRRIALVPGGTAPRAPVHVEDVARAVLAAREVAAEVVTDGFLALDLPGTESVSFADLVRATAAARGWRRPTVVEVPAEAVQLGARVARRLPGGGRIADRLAGMQEHVAPSGAPARALLGWSPRALSDVLSS